MIVQLATVSHRSDPTEYWDDVEEDTFEIDGRENEYYKKEFDSFEECWELCDRKNVIVSETNIYKKELSPQEVDFCVKVYDGYNE